MTDTHNAGTATVGAFQKALSTLGFVGAAGVLLLCLHTVVNAVLRGLGGEGITGTLEVVGYWYMPLIALLGFSLAKRRNEQIEASLVYDRVPAAVKRDFDLTAHLLLVVLSLVFIWYGWLEALHASAIEKTAGISSILVWPTFFLVPLGFALLAVQSVADGYRIMCERNVA